MSIKKAGQEGEYHQLSDKKKFLFRPFSCSGDTFVIHSFFKEKFLKFRKKIRIKNDYTKSIE